MLLAALLVGLGLAVVSAHAANQTVTATSSDTFSPEAVTISQGETVTWNNGGGNHNVRFDNGSFADPATPSTSSWTVSHRFDTPGTFHYVCEQHAPDMEGTVTVTPSRPAPTLRPPPPRAGGGDPRRHADRGHHGAGDLALRHDPCPFPREEGGESAFVFRVSEPVDVRIKISRVLKRRGRTRSVEKGTLVRTELRRTSQKVPFSGRLRAVPCPPASTAGPSRPPTWPETARPQAHLVPHHRPLSSLRATFGAPLQCRARCAVAPSSSWPGSWRSPCSRCRRRPREAPRPRSPSTPGCAGRGSSPIPA